MRPARSALDGITAAAPRSLRLARSQLLSKAFTDERRKIETGDQRLDTDAVVTLSGQKDEANEIAEGVDQGHDFGGQAATRTTYGLILIPPFAPVPCWWTRTSVPSMRTYSKSGSSQRALKARSQTPFCARRQKRV
jgi:hypothetical protein